MQCSHEIGAAGGVEIGVWCKRGGIQDCGSVGSDEEMVGAGGGVKGAPTAVELAQREERLRSGGAVKAHVHVVARG